jgi:hypothetical protein
MFQLPVSAREVDLRMPGGAEDLLLLEHGGGEVELAIQLIARLARPREGSAPDWAQLPVADIEALLLAIRRMVLGDVIRAGIRCPASGCGARVDVDFSIAAYLGHHRSRIPPWVEPEEEPGWFRLRGQPVRFRIPNGADQAAALCHPYPERELVRRLIQPPGIARGALTRIETAMAAIAPSLSGSLEGRCPECRAAIPVHFDVLHFVLGELKNQAMYFHEDVHLLARNYHWSEESILALPSRRRLRYAELAAEASGLA